jgi:histone H3/H4
VDDQSHSITKALANPLALDTALILAKSIERYRSHWIRIAESVIPKNGRRSQDAEDALQEALSELTQRLNAELGRRAKQGRTFETGEDILRWGSQVVKNDAIDVPEENRGLDGAASVGGPGETDASLAHDNPLEQLASTQRVTEILPDVQVQEAEIQLKYSKLGEAVERELGLLCSPDYEIVDRWLNWGTFRAIAQEFKLTVRNVRVTTFDFKTQPSVNGIAEEVRNDLDEAEKRWPGVAERIVWNGRGGRVLVDRRDEE